MQFRFPVRSASQGNGVPSCRRNPPRLKPLETGFISLWRPNAKDIQERELIHRLALFPRTASAGKRPDCHPVRQFSPSDRHDRVPPWRRCHPRGMRRSGKNIARPSPRLGRQSLSSIRGRSFGRNATRQHEDPEGKTNAKNPCAAHETLPLERWRSLLPTHDPMPKDPNYRILYLQNWYVAFAYAME